MGVQFPDEMEVICDQCGDAAYMNSTTFAGDLGSCGVTQETLNESGWTVDEDSTFCPDCSKERSEPDE